jgi:hypothetical protein
MWVVWHRTCRWQHSQFLEHHIRHTSNSVKMNKSSIGLQSGTFLNLRLLLLENAIKEKTLFNKCNIIQKTWAWERTSFFWDVRLCHLVASSWHFEATWSLRHQGSSQTLKPFKMKAVLSLNTLETDYPGTWHRIPQERSPQLHAHAKRIPLIR